jgi:hypothetical protein
VSAIFLALVAAGAGMATPLFLALLTGRQLRRGREAEWARQDEIHARDKADIEASNEKINGKLEVIHTLVNSNMTAALKAEYDGAVREVMLMRELGRPASVIADADTKIAELRAVLEDRLRQTTLVDQQIAEIKRTDEGTE